MEKILGQQLLVRGQAFATFSTIEKAPMSRGPYVVQAQSRA